MLTAIPFFFLPKTLPKEGLEDNAEIIKNDKEIYYEKIGPQQMCKFAYYPNGYLIFPGYERTKFMIFPDCYEE